MAILFNVLALGLPPLLAGLCGWAGRRARKDW